MSVFLWLQSSHSYTYFFALHAGPSVSDSASFSLYVCTQDGVTAYECSGCKATKEVTTPALGHKYGEYTEKGTGHAKQCSVCGDYTPMAPHLSHSPPMNLCSSFTKSASSTPQSPQWKVWPWPCQRQGCDATKEEPVDAQVSHTYGDKIAEKPAACEVPGMKEHYECEVCGKLFVGTHEVSAEDLEIPALEHSFTHYVPDNLTGEVVAERRKVKCPALRAARYLALIHVLAHSLAGGRYGGSSNMYSELVCMLDRLLVTAVLAYALVIVLVASGRDCC
mgnify:CR=1 FL=1